MQELESGRPAEKRHRYFRYRVGGDRAIRRLCPRIGRSDCRSRRTTLHPPAKSTGSKGLGGEAERVGPAPEKRSRASASEARESVRKRRKESAGSRGAVAKPRRGGGRIRARGRASGPNEERIRRWKAPWIEEAFAVDATKGEAVLAVGSVERPSASRHRVSEGLSTIVIWNPNRARLRMAS